jgi:hypothetical protein
MAADGGSGDSHRFPSTPPQIGVAGCRQRRLWPIQSRSRAVACDYKGRNADKPVYKADTALTAELRATERAARRLRQWVERQEEHHNAAALRWTFRNLNGKRRRLGRLAKVNDPGESSALAVRSAAWRSCGTDLDMTGGPLVVSRPQKTYIEATVLGEEQFNLAARPPD